MARRTKKGPKQVEALRHDEAKRKNIPTAELQSAAQRAEEISPIKPVTYLRNDPLPKGEKRQRDEDLDPQIIWKGATLRLSPDQIAELSETGRLEIGDAQLVWRGKDQQDWSDLVVQAPPLYIQEKIHPKAIIEDLKRQTKERQEADADMPDLFADFNGIDPEAKTEFYQHDQNWQNRMILGDSLQVMASLAEREGLRGQVQCIYFDPPYGIRFNSNWQVSTRSRDVSDGKLHEITREPEQVRAFRDTWKDGIHSYLTYLRDRLVLMRDLLAESGSIFVQIGEENVHKVRGILDEVFGEENFASQLSVFKTTTPRKIIDNNLFYILWYAKDVERVKYRQVYDQKPLKEWTSETKGGSWGVLDAEGYRSLTPTEKADPTTLDKSSSVYQLTDMFSSGASKELVTVEILGRQFKARSNTHWKTTPKGVNALEKASRIEVRGDRPWYRRFHSDWPLKRITNVWSDTSGKASQRIYVVQTQDKVVERCLLMSSDPGDIVLDPTCGSGTSAHLAEKWGRRWITIDTSRVALALARTRLMASTYPYFYLQDSPEGKVKDAEVTGRPPKDGPTHGDVRQGFVYERAAHITLGSIAKNAEIEVIWEEYQARLEPLRQKIIECVGHQLDEWEIPSVLPDDWPPSAQKLLAEWWKARNARQDEIDASIERNANLEFLYDRPYVDTSKVRVTGPFTVESLSPHRVVPADEAELIEQIEAAEGKRERKNAPLNDFTSMVLENLKSAGVHQAAKDDRITFTALEGWPGGYVAAEGHFMEGETEKRAAIFIGPEFGTVTRADLTAAAREALDARFDALIACGFNFDAHTSELTKLGPLPILKAKMNPDLHMSEELKNTGAGNMFVVFGEPDIEWKFNDDGDIIVEVLGVDVFDPKTGEVRASGKDDIAAWFIDTDYNEESFFVRHAYFMGASDPYKSLKTSLKAEIDKEAWETLYRDKSRPFARPSTGRFAVKVINHFGDEVMKVFSV
ncbi:site-specific DNA-methyltransferase [Hyphococcus sp.]|uniref:site-specific DNA-methyltransferase n=1 Tax=Hyphococcus sp. TaxID=2038636 RepID=UPI0035C696DA